MRTKDITINGVTLRLYKMSPFEQYELLNTFIPALAGVVRAFTGSKDMKDGLADAIENFLSKVDHETRTKLIFNHLLADSSVKILYSGTTLPLIAREGKAQTVMNDDLDDVTYLLQIAVEVLKFNFERFFALGKTTLAPKSNQIATLNKQA